MARQAWEIPRSGPGPQRLLNAVGEPGRFPLAWTLAPEPAGPIPVEARLVWASDGAEHVRSLARAWTRTLVLVEVRDERWPLGTAWLPAADVRRLVPPSGAGVVA
ncbi:hypothetical protein [Litorihabitans aurantiacus]|uniref:Uncharacterized protein n=1 Tax=Litorihabitans aurantiacus TaxID=1930061 RepID=A0AA38CTQ0_9MICO|nr:hypothetical protein [Litorihabitans aurantiacus]GMA31555.1 hypothetical protein GCM10025875_15470 [Litorihabitans aurantiacus]